MFVRNFSYDSISDLTSQVICKELYTFTIETVKTLGYTEFIHNSPASITYWNNETNDWICETVDESFIVQGKFTILIPNNIVELKHFSKNPSDYIRNVIVPRIQTELLLTSPSQKTSKKDIITAETKAAGGAKQWIRKDIEKYPQDFINYFES